MKPTGYPVDQMGRTFTWVGLALAFIALSAFAYAQWQYGAGIHRVLTLEPEFRSFNAKNWFLWLFPQNFGLSAVGVAWVASVALTLFAMYRQARSKSESLAIPIWVMLVVISNAFALIAFGVVLAVVIPQLLARP